MHLTNLSDHLSLSGRRWNVQQSKFPAGGHFDPALLIAQLLRERNLSLEEQLLPSPDVFPDMSSAVGRIEKAIAREEPIGIFGDYDCDGITAVAQLCRFFGRRGIDPLVRLPHRVRDGYGLSESIVRDCIDAGLTLLITADTGITAAKHIAKLQEYGIDVIVTDHHALPAELPEARALLHPALASDFPQPYPSGAGVVFHLLRALERDVWEGREVDEALAMIGTVADLVPLHGGNRTLVVRGLCSLAALRDGPLARLRDEVKSGDAPLTSTDIAFRLAPRINAAGRMDDPTVALTALLRGGESIALLSRLNGERQRATEDLMKKLLLEVEGNDSPFLVAVSEHYHPGIIGLLAGKLCENTGRPALVAYTDGTLCTGSLRSPRTYDVTAGLVRVASAAKSCHPELACLGRRVGRIEGQGSPLLMSFGGHAQAAGCSFALTGLEELKRTLSADVSSHVPKDSLRPTLEIDAALDPRDISPRFAEQLRRLEPFGQGNPEPLFLLEHVTIMDPRCVGRENRHFQARVGGVKAVGFGLGQFLEHCAHPLDLACRLGENAWNGRRELQLFIEDMRVTTRAPSSLPSERLPQSANSVPLRS